MDFVFVLNHFKFLSEPAFQFAEEVHYLVSYIA